MDPTREAHAEPSGWRPTQFHAEVVNPMAPVAVHGDLASEIRGPQIVCRLAICALVSNYLFDSVKPSSGVTLENP